ncbi:deoxyribose-phosphate aldolase [Pseudoramibacter faecis]|uniref:deoxyribose-phosphate aldolase n=1 Tax=Pseudoramibacter faecis TaxID=3108534 RepID=UPI002E7A84C6|nr:deoxyribose-phosphate aldolase [Pseudoramibacter sp. HA2172]
MIDLKTMSAERFAKVFDMAILAPETQEEAIREGCRQAREYNIAAFYTTPCWTSVVAEALEGSDVKVGAAISFPYGTLTSEMKMAEIDDALKNGATAIDMVINIGALKDGNIDLVEKEIRGQVEKCHNRNVLCKTILEIGTLTDKEIAVAARTACQCGVDYVKTGTGANILPNEHQLQIMKDYMANGAKMKFSGIPRQFQLAACLRMIELGVELIGTRSAIQLIDQYKKYLAEKERKL